MKAIVLSGGGFKGAYELGVWKALKKLNIKYDIVTGTSIGSLNGMLMVQNEFYKCLRLWKTVTYDMLYDNFDNIKNNYDMYKNYFDKIIKGGINTNKIEKLIDEYFNEKKLYNSKIKFGIVSFNVSSKSVVYSTKSNTTPKKMKKYLLASATCFPVFKPTIIGNEMLIDGGYYDNLPINLAVSLGATDIIAVDLRAVGIKQKVKNKNVKITYIVPKNRLDSFLKIDTMVSKKLINFGYNDTMKKFKKLEGNYYTFKRKTLDIILNKLHLDKLKSLEYVGNFKNYEKHFLNIVEDAIKIFELPEDKIYDFHINKLLFEKLDSTKLLNFNNFKLEELKKILNRAIITKYIYVCLVNNTKIHSVFTFFPKEYTTAIYLFILRR